MKQAKHLLIASMLLIGCDPSHSDVTEDFSLPEEMSDCKIFSVCSSLRCLQAIRCPNSQTTTTYKSGKYYRTISVIE